MSEMVCDELGLGTNAVVFGKRGKEPPRRRGSAEAELNQLCRGV